MLCRNRAGQITQPRVGGLAYRSGYGQRLYPGYRSQLESHIPTIKERTFQVWRKIMMTGCTVVVGKDVESHREQSGAKSRVAAIVTLSYLDCS
jgi:hypothetical protein